MGVVHRGNNVIMKRLLVLTLFLVIMISSPIQAQAQSGTVLVHVTSFSLDHGVVVSGDITKLRVEDGDSLIFRETKSLFAGEQEITPLPTEDDADKWYTVGNFGSLDNVTTDPLVGSYCLEMVANGTGIAKLLFDNGTGNAMNFIAIDSAFINFSLRVSLPRFVLSEVRAYQTLISYAYIQTNINLDTNWQTYSLTRSDMTFEHIQLGDPINWLEFTFTVQTGGSEKSVFYDGGGFYGVEPDDVIRLGSGEILISNIPQGYDNYVLNITVTHFVDTDYGDLFFTDNADNWIAGTGVTLSNDDSVQIHGANALKIEYDPTQGNGSIIFDNGTSQNMQADFSAYDNHEVHSWGNTSFTVQSARWYTDSDNYFFVDVAVTYTTDSSIVYTLPLSLYSQFGSPSFSNISWVEFSWNNISNSAPLTAWMDGLYLTDSDKVIFSTDCDCEVTFESTHSHEETGDFHWASTEIVLNYTRLVSAGFVVTTSMNDTKAFRDEFNTTILIDAFYITAWMDPTTTTASNIFTELFLSTEMWGYFGPLALVIIGVLLTKKNKELGILLIIVESLLISHYLTLIGDTPEYWWHVIILLFGVILCLIQLLDR